MTKEPGEEWDEVVVTGRSPKKLLEYADPTNISLEALLYYVLVGQGSTRGKPAVRQPLSL